MHQVINWLTRNNSTMHWLIIEDALRDRKGHWAEYIGTFCRGLKQLGDEVTILCDCKAEEFITSSLMALPVLTESIWHRMGDGAGLLTRYFRIPAHAFKTWFSVSKYLVSGFAGKSPDVIFVPTVLPHHFLGWYFILKSRLLDNKTSLLLFFPNLPLKVDRKGNASWILSPTSRLMAWIFQLIRPMVESKRVVLGVETEKMQLALAMLTGLPVIYLPHPVEPLPTECELGMHVTYFAAYGVARAEKGSDLFQSAIEEYLIKYPESRVRFAIQWIDSFEDGSGNLINISETLSNSGRVDVIRSFFQQGEYAERLMRTSVVVLPYRFSSYGLRVSRVVIEAMVNGIPVIATEGTTLSDQLRKFGTGECCRDEDIASLVLTMRELELKYSEYAESAVSAKTKAREHFSVANFRNLLQTFIQGDSAPGKITGDSEASLQRETRSL